jgi:hypothetical protein
MTDMFTNYENDTQSPICPPRCEGWPKKGTKLLTNIKGETLGVQVDINDPIQLYFHLENICDVEMEEILPGTTLFEILTTTHKIVTSEEYLTAEILNSFTGDLLIYLPQSKMTALKKETYVMRVTLQTATNTYKIFTESDGYLVIR